jgi:hypothetical protein
MLALSVISTLSGFAPNAQEKAFNVLDILILFMPKVNLLLPASYGY